jgi:hypothetical protein
VGITSELDEMAARAWCMAIPIAPMPGRSDGLTPECGLTLARFWAKMQA